MTDDEDLPVIDGDAPDEPPAPDVPQRDETPRNDEVPES